MSEEMMENTKTSSPFKKLSDDPVLHILSYLPGADLLRLSSVNQNLKSIITESHETMKKIALVLNFDKDDNLDLDNAIKLARARRFTSLKLQSASKLFDLGATVKLISLLEVLSGSVEDLTISYEIPRQLLYTIIAMLFPKLKKCKLYNVIFEGISLRSNISHPLQSLEIIDTHASKVLPLFVGCKQLKTFNYQCSSDNDTEEDNEHLNNFLAARSHLDKLIITVRGLAWHRLICYQLKELSVNFWSDIDQFGVYMFLKKLPHLEMLDIVVFSHLSRRLMDTICKIPKLKKLSIQTWWDQVEDENDDGDSLEGLKNHTVKELNIVDYTNVTSKLLTIFLGADSIDLQMLSDELDLSDVPPTTIMKIKPNVDYCCEGFAVKFSPSELPTNVEEFQSSVMKFASEFSKLITGIVIGNKTWRNRGGDFNLSNSFCEGLVNILPNLVTLDVFNITNRGKFIAFLGENEGHLEDVQLHQSFGADEPKPKKMKIQID